MTILSLFFIMAVFMVAGFAVDMMRYDSERVKLQYALDRAVLAAADLDQELCPADVVKDYLSKENLDQYLVEGSIKVTPETCGATDARLAGKRKVEASAEMNVATHFMQWNGVDYIASNATSVAEESIGNVEISLVLDVSGSMDGTKLANLQTAAKDFVDEMVNKSEDGKLSISIIPYSEQVSVPNYLMNELTTIGANEVANCIDFPLADFSTMEFDNYDIFDSGGTLIRPGTAIPQTLHFDDYGSTDFRQSDNLVASNVCRRETSTDRRAMAVIQNDVDTLKQQIDLLNASGWTSIDVGLKWGLTLLDDSIQPLIARLASTSAIPSEFAGRPGRNRTADSLKVLVLMTDGANTKQHMVNAPYYTGPSDIHWNDGAQTYSVYDEANDRYSWSSVRQTVRHNDGSRWTRDYYQNHAYGARKSDGSRETFRRYRCTSFYDGKCHSINSSSYYTDTEYGDTLELDWPDVWAHSEKHVIYYLLRDTFGTTKAQEWWDKSTTELQGYQKDPRVYSLCAQAEAEEVLIFSIAYEAPESVKPMLKTCAVDDGRYYEATGTKIQGVFDSISATIQNLRLTQ
ncbi:pilus assembly protein TadG-related protein [Ruegeria arenilitoris]|nr:pilus assembly protein TadG-related protein [Ruegeria arenilitoris]